MVRQVLLVVVVITLVLTGGCERGQVIPPSGKVVKLGIVGPFDGADSAMGQRGLNGIKAALYLRPLLANGDAIELVTVDDRNDPALTRKAIHTLAADEEVSAILLASSSDSALAAGPVADKLRVPVLALSATHSDIARDRGFISQLCSDNSFQGSVAALFVRDELLLDKVAVIRNAGSFYSDQLADEFVRKFRAVGGEITDILATRGESDALAEAMQRLASLETELLYLPMNADAVIPVLKVVDAMDWSPELMGSDGLLATALVEHPDDVGLLEGMYATDFFSSNIPLSGFGDKAVKAYHSLFSDDGTTYAALGAEACEVLSDAMDRCSSPRDRECVNRMVRSTERLEGVLGRISINEEGKASRPVVVNAIVNERLRYVVKVY